MANQDIYLRAIMSIVARQTFPPEELAQLVGKDKQLIAYNLCDGSRTQTDVAKELALDGGNFSKTLSRWVELGIIIKVTEGKEQRPIHLYPLPASKTDKGKGKGDA